MLSPFLIDSQLLMEMAVEIAVAREERTSGLLGCRADSLRVKSACGARPLCRPRGRSVVLPKAGVCSILDTSQSPFAPRLAGRPRAGAWRPG